MSTVPAQSLTRLRVVGMSVISFVLMLSYSLARPATESLFIESHTADGLPVVWLITAVAVIGVVGIYNRFVTRRGLLRLFGSASLLSAAVATGLLMAVELEVQGALFLLYAWKDIYIILLVEIFYSYTNSVFPIRQARWFYGLFGLIGSIGGLIGGLGAGEIAQHFGTTAVVWLVPGLLIGLWLICQPLARRAGAGPSRGEEGSSTHLIEAVRVVSRSRYLLWMLGLVAITQVAITLVDFEFNRIVEAGVPNVDDRTAFVGQVYAAISAATLVLNALTGPVLRLAGVPLTLLAIPLLLGSGVGGLFLFPGLLVVAGVKVASKSFDYTLYRTAKEILYIPLSYTERTAGKSVTDMLTYRVAKGIASLVLLGLLAAELTELVLPLTLVLVGVWLGDVAVIVRRFRSVVSREREMAGGKVVEERASIAHGDSGPDTTTAMPRSEPS